MRTTDFSPLFRHSVGFDRMQRLLDSATRLDTNAQAYPPYNIEAQGEDEYRITMAVAGFSPNELEVTVSENTVVISGKHTEDTEAVGFLHRGIARRSFERRFDLADTIKVTGSFLDNGMLHVTLVREVPEEKKPRQITIQTTDNTATDSHKIETKQAA
ncbi:MAG: Hsp20 family protein [Rhodospirillaceae bacterium]|nr:Hsp20 family protein [Rhodospirillaceae bacterium]